MAGRRKTVKVLVKQHWADTPHIRKRCNHVEGSVSEELEEEVEDKTNHAHQPHQQEDNHPCYKRKTCCTQFQTQFQTILRMRPVSNLPHTKYPIW